MVTLFPLPAADPGPLRPGRRFLHRRVLDAATGAPLECEITAVRRRAVFWRPADSRRPSRDYFLLEQAERFILKMLD